MLLACALPGRAADGGASGPDDARFRVSRTIAARAGWLSIEADRLVFGAGRRIWLAGPAANPALTGERVLAEPLIAGVLIDGRLHAIAADGDLLQFESLAAGVTPVRWHMPGRRATRLARMGNHFVVADEQLGLHVFATVGGHHAQRLETPLRVASLELHRPVEAIAGTSQGWYVVIGGELIEFDARDPAHPRVVARRPLTLPVRALATTPERLYLLEPSGLRTLERQGGGESFFAFEHSEAVAVVTAGRVLHVAAGEAGLIRLQDVSTRAQEFSVTVGNNFFSPQSLTIEVGDMVRWNSAAFGGFHNVQSCTAGQAGCGGVAAEESFTNGPAAPSPWIYRYTFTRPGQNPYVCVVHVPGMTGLVEVVAAPPPAVPGGAAGEPMTAGKLQPDGSLLSLNWDAEACPGAVNYHLILGRGFELPVGVGQPFLPSGSRCALGSPPYVWDAVPETAPAAGDWVWWLVVADDGAVTEGPWGGGAGGQERSGGGAGGVSDVCGMTIKDTSNACGAD